MPSTCGPSRQECYANRGACAKNAVAMNTIVFPARTTRRRKARKTRRNRKTRSRR